jgi:Inner membrane component of T3SS, cytoplasmic domain
MRCKVRYVARQRSGGVSHSDQTFNVEGQRISLGRGTDCHLFLKDLRASYHHAEIVVRDFDVVIEAVDDSALTIDGVPVERAAITPESEIEVGPYRLQLLREPDADLSLSVELTSPPPQDTIDKLIEPRRVGLDGGLLRKRALSWALFLLLITVGLALPIVAHRLAAPDTTTSGPAASGADAAHGGSPLAGFDRIWISGDLSSSHRLLSQQCGACHEAPFVPIRSEACSACHRDTQHHFDTAKFAFAGFDPTRCTACHSEHEGATGAIPARQDLCADCHRDLRRQAPETELINAADFGADHPEFRPSVLTEPASGRIARVALGAPDFPKEVSNLRFPHDIHLAETCEVPASGQDVPLETRQKCGVLRMARQRMNQEGLNCRDCHRPEPGGVNMLPVRMQDHCALCHRLEFDQNAPERVLPHGQPAEVIAVVNDYYIARAALDQPLALELPQGIRQRPGEGTPPAQPQAVAPNPLATAEEVAARKLEVVFGRSLCGVCHEIVPPATSASGQWEVLPIRVAALWMPKATFNHAAHETTPCTDCHRARESKLSADVLMPAIGDCRTCHQGEHAATALPSTCIMCHVYHRDELPPMLPPATEAAAAPR